MTLVRFVLVTLSLCLGGCNSMPDDAALAESVSSPGEREAVAALRWLDEADPVADAERDRRAGRLQLLTLGGRGWTLPGIAAEQTSRVLENCGVHILPGAVDTVLGDEHLAYLRRARDYALRYNLVMVDTCLNH